MREIKMKKDVNDSFSVEWNIGVRASILIL